MNVRPIIKILEGIKNKFMGKKLAKPPMVELIGNQKALWELTIRYCSD